MNSPPLRPGFPVSELYDLEADPLELENLADAEPELRARLAALLREEREALGAIGRAELDVPEDAPDELKARLRALGYVE